MNVKVLRVGDLTAKFDRLKKGSERAIARGTTKAAFILQKDARKRIMKGPKSGKRYGKHRASAPGEAPANDTGNLARSITVVAARPSPNAQAIVMASTEYAKALEYGTKRAGPARNGEIRPRPFLRPAIEATKDEMNRVIQEEIARG